MLLPQELKIHIVSQLDTNAMINYLCVSKDSYKIIEKSLQIGWVYKLKNELLDKLLIKNDYSTKTFYHLLLSRQIDHAKKYNRHLMLMFWNLLQFNEDQVYKLAVKLLQRNEFKLLDKIINYKPINFWDYIQNRFANDIDKFTFDQCLHLAEKNCSSIVSFY